MANPTNDDQNGRPRLRLRLDSGEVLDVDGTTVDSGPCRPAPAVVLRLTRGARTIWRMCWRRTRR